MHYKPITRHELRYLLILTTWLFPSNLLALSQMGNISIGAGPQIANEPVTINENSSTNLSMFQLDTQVSFVTGWEDIGGIVLTFEFAPGLSAKWSDSKYYNASGATGSADVGWDFFVPLGKYLTFRYGPRLAGALVLSNANLDSSGDQESAGAVTWGLGAAAQMDWHPIDTGWALEDALFIYISAKTIWDAPGPLTGRAILTAGVGFGLD